MAIQTRGFSPEVTLPLRMAGMFVALLAWTVLAGWVYLDARSRGNANAPSWGLLTMLTGPVALLVWLISRRTPEPLPAVPACPQCRAPVALDWAPCGACGESLQ